MQSIPCTLTIDEVQTMIKDRTAARRVRDFRTADAIKNDLLQGGIQLFDRENKWEAYDGSIGGMQSKDFRGGSGRNRNDGGGDGSDYRNEPLPCTLSGDEIHTLLDERTLAIRRRNFALAADIRAAIASKGVEVVYK